MRTARRYSCVLIVLALLGTASRLTGQVRPTAVQVSQRYAASQLVKKVNPEYPKDLQKKRIEGLVTLRIRISKEGDVKMAELVSGHPELAPLAIEAVKQWKYKPYLIQGTPWEVVTTVQINFTLANSLRATVALTVDRRSA